MAIISRRLLLLTALSASTAAALAATEDDPLGLLIHDLSSQRTQAEDLVALLKEYAKPDKLKEGVLLYIAARAAYNGLIDQLLLDLERAGDTNTSPGFHRNLNAAVEKQEVFVAEVKRTVLGSTPAGSRGPLGDIVAGAGPLIKGLTESWLAIRQAYSESKKAEIRNQLDRQRWKPFGQIH